MCEGEQFCHKTAAAAAAVNDGDADGGDDDDGDGDGDCDVDVIMMCRSWQPSLSYSDVARCDVEQDSSGSLRSSTLSPVIRRWTFCRLSSTT